MSKEKYIYVEVEENETVIDYIKRLHQMQQEVGENEVVYGKYDKAYEEKAYGGDSFSVFFDGKHLPVIDQNAEYIQVDAPNGIKADSLKKMVLYFKNGDFTPENYFYDGNSRAEFHSMTEKQGLGNEHMYVVFNSPPAFITSDEMRVLGEIDNPDMLPEQCEKLISMKQERQRILEKIDYERRNPDRGEI